MTVCLFHAARCRSSWRSRSRACGEAPQQQAAPPPPAVTVAKPVQRTIVDQDEYVGRFVAVDSVEIRARVSGYLDKIHFKDGEIVKQGDLLFTIDRRPFQNMLDQVRANLAQAKANLAFTEADLQRAQSLVRERTITEQLFDQRTQANRTAQAQVDGAGGRGQAGRARSAVHRIARTDHRPDRRPARLAGQPRHRRHHRHDHAARHHRIDRSDPLRIHLRRGVVPALRARRQADVGRGNRHDQSRLKLLDEKDFAHKGKMDFVDNVIDRSSGTIRGRAQFSNAKVLFTPGMFARVQVPGSPPYQALLVPDQAIGTDQGRKFVLVVTADNTATPKYVTLGNVIDGMLRVVKEGLTADDRVIVNGLMRARAGQKVTPQEQGAQTSTAPQAKTQ